MTGAPSGTGSREPSPAVSALRASIPSALADKVFAVLAELEGYTPPDSDQDWTCVGAAQVIRALCLILTESSAVGGEQS